MTDRPCQHGVNEDQRWLGLTDENGNPAVMQIDSGGKLEIITVQPEDGACKFCYLPPGMHDNSCPTLR
jgi:hypothetical protein